jgi:aryl-alcohol dehydrogenase-like predicted oxidoreductase
LDEPGEDIPPIGQAVSWELNNPPVTSIQVAFASMAELEQTLGSI